MALEDILSTAAPIVSLIPGGGIIGAALGGLGGLLGGSSAAKRAEERRQSILAAMTGQANQQYSDALNAGSRAGYGLTGTLNDTLASTGRALGGAQAGAGVYNNSAVSGGLSNLAAENAGAVANYLRQTQADALHERNLGLNQANMAALGVQNNNVGYARDQLGGAQGGFAQLLRQLPSVLGGGAGAAGGSNVMYGGAYTGEDTPQPYAGSLPTNVTGGLSGSRSVLDPIQSDIQTLTQRNRKMMGGLDSRTTGDYLNGMQGFKLPKIGAGLGY